LPCLIIPAFLVPGLMFLHAVIFARLAGGRADVRSREWREESAATG